MYCWEELGGCKVITKARDICDDMNRRDDERIRVRREKNRVLREEKEKRKEREVLEERARVVQLKGAKAE